MAVFITPSVAFSSRGAASTVGTVQGHPAEVAVRQQAPYQPSRETAETRGRAPPGSCAPGRSTPRRAGGVPAKSSAPSGRALGPQRPPLSPACPSSRLFEGPRSLQMSQVCKAVSETRRTRLLPEGRVAASSRDRWLRTCLVGRRRSLARGVSTKAGVVYEPSPNQVPSGMEAMRWSRTRRGVVAPDDSQWPPGVWIGRRGQVPKSPCWGGDVRLDTDIVVA